MQVADENDLGAAFFGRDRRVHGVNSMLDYVHELGGEHAYFVDEYVILVQYCLERRRRGRERRDPREAFRQPE